MGRDESPTQATFQLQIDEAHVWLANLRHPAWESASATVPDPLNPQERKRAEHFAREQDAIHWSRSRVLLRLLLARYLGTDPSKLRFELGEQGKPRLVGHVNEAIAPTKTPLHFNLAHSGAFAVYAVMLNQPVGVDIETLDRKLDVLAVARRAFGVETSRRLKALQPAERHRELLKLWVCHEAVLKYTGAGLSDRSTLTRDPLPWVKEIDVGEGRLAALATARQPAAIKRGDAMVALEPSVSGVQS